MTPKLAAPPPLMAQKRSSWFPVEDCTIHIHNQCINNVVHREPIFSHHVTIATSCEVSTCTESKADTSRESMDFALRRNCVVNFSESCTRLNPCTLISQIDIDGPEIKHVKNNKGLVGNIREALIVMTTTSYSDFQAYTFGTNNSGLNVGVVLGRYNQQWLWGCGSGN